MKKISTVISCVMIAISLLIIITAMSYPPAKKGVPGPGFFPTILGVIVIILSFSLLISQRHEEDVPVKLFTKEMLPIYYSMAMIVGYLLLLHLVGFMVATPIFLFSIMKLFKVKKLWVILVVAFATTILTYLIFTKLLAVILPYGMLF